MSKAFAILATCEPTLPRPIKPKILPLSSTPTVVCQYPWYILSISFFKFLANPKISAQVNSQVGLILISVPVTMIFLFLAASKSIALFLMPLVDMYFNFFKLFIRLGVIFVLSLIINKASKSFSCSIALFSFSNGSLKTLISYFPESFFRSINS